MTNDYCPPHEHCCEIKLFHSKHRDVWKRECPLHKKPKNHDVGSLDICDDCDHLIIVDFYDRECINAKCIWRGGRSAAALIQKYAVKKEGGETDEIKLDKIDELDSPDRGKNG